MTTLEALGTIAASFGVSFAASFLPVGGGVEVYLLATSALLPTGYVAPLVVASAMGSVAAKTVLYMGARKAGTLPGVMQGRRGAQLLTRIQEGPWIRRGIIASATTLSLPPFYALALAAGLLRTPRAEFIIISVIGQSLRFGAVWAVPQIAGWLAAR